MDIYLPMAGRVQCTRNAIDPLPKIGSPPPAHPHSHTYVPTLTQNNLVAKNP